MKEVNVRNVTLGPRPLKIILSVAEADTTALMKTTGSASGTDYDLFEWRVDFFTEDFLPAAEVLRDYIGETPLIFTFRSQAQGGRKITPDAYGSLYMRAIDSGFIDIVDIEADIEGAETLLKYAARHNVKTILSRHDFEKTPSVKEMTQMLWEMQQTGADILKLAVTPNSRMDVIALLSATAQTSEELLTTPIITVSMGEEGLVSRFAGDCFGCAATYAYADIATAPGQMSAKNLRAILNCLAE